MSGYYGIGIENGKTVANLGTLWRSAQHLGASFIFTIGRRYRSQSSDTTKAWKNIPLFHYESFEEFYDHLPNDCQLVGIEYPLATAISLPEFVHPKRCVYLLGAEDHGLSKAATQKLHCAAFIPSSMCLNVAVAGSIVMYDRAAKAKV